MQFPQSFAFFVAGNTIVINPNGLFVYNGKPANGNLLLSIAPSSGNDVYGNLWLQGLTIFFSNSPLVAINLNGGQVFFVGQPLSGSISVPGGDQLQFVAPSQGGSDPIAKMSLLSGAASPLAGSAVLELFNTALYLLQGSNAVSIQVNASGQLQVNGVALANSFTTFGSYSVVQGPSGNVVLYFQSISNPAPQFQIQANGALGWGPGTSGIDTFLGRDAAGSLQVTSGIHADSFHDITSGFSNSWSGQIQYKFLVEEFLVFIRFRISVPNGTVVATNSTIYSALPAGYYFSSDNTEILLSLGNTPVDINIGSTGIISYAGPGFTASGTEFLYGQATYSTAA